MKWFIAVIGVVLVVLDANGQQSFNDEDSLRIVVIQLAIAYFILDKLDDLKKDSA